MLIKIIQIERLSQGAKFFFVCAYTCDDFSLRLISLDAHKMV